MTLPSDVRNVQMSLGFGMDVILHVGAHRTGTTTLQRFLKANSEHLAGEQIGFWGPDKTRDGLFSGLIKAPNRITDDDLRRGKRATGLIKIELERASQSGLHSVIISEENMIGSMENNINTRRLYSQTRARLERFQDGFGFQCARILLTTRSYDRYWASVLGYYIKAGHGLPSATVIDALAEQPVRWSRVIRDIAAAFPEAEIIVSPFEAMIGLPEHQLASLTGYTVPGPFQAGREWHNAGPDRAQLVRLLEDQGNGAADIARIGGGPGPWQPFNPAQVAVMRAAYGQDLAWLRAGADGMAIYIDSPEALSAIEGGTGQKRGPNHDKEHRRLG